VLLLTVSAAAAGGTARAAPSTLHRMVTVTDRDDGHTVTLRLGQRLRVVLASTYWEFRGSSHPAVLRLAVKPQITPQPAGCVTGGGCGTAIAIFVAAAPGRSTVTATRNSCGEAMGCTAAGGKFALAVVVH
jgi:hypothetical protein